MAFFVSFSSINDQIRNRAAKVALDLDNGTAVTYTFTKNTCFLLVIERANTSSAVNAGLYIGYAFNSSHIKAILDSSSCNVSISGKVLTMTASATNMVAYIIPFEY